MEVWAYALLFFLMALVFNTELQVQFTLPKLLVLHAMIPVLTGFWIARLRRDEVRGLPQTLLVAAIALSVWWTVSTMFAVHQPTAVHGYHGRYNGLLSHLLLLFLFLIVASSRFAARDIERLAAWAVAALVATSCYALIQFAGWDPIAWPGARPASTIGNPVILGGTLGLAIPFALSWTIAWPGLGKRCFWGAILLLHVGALFTTLSRGPVLAAIAGVFVVLAAWIWDYRSRLHKAAVVIAVVAAVLVPAIAYQQVVNIRQYTRDPVDPTRSIQGRFYTITAALHMTRDHPIVGVGLENFAVLYPRYKQAASEDLMPDVLPTMVHSGYLQAAATTGLPGLLAYLAVLASAVLPLAPAFLRSTDSRDRRLIAAFAGAISAYLVQDLVGWLEISLSAFFWIVLGLGAALTRVTAGDVVRRTVPLSVGYAAAIVTAASLWLAARDVNLIAADRSLRHADQFRVTDAWPQVEADVAAALERTSEHAHVDRAGVRYAERFAATGDPAAYRRSVELFDEARRGGPHNSYYLIHRLSVAAVALQKNIPHEGSETDALVRLASQLDPHNATLHETVARLRLAQGRHDEALASIQAARKLRPNHGKLFVLEGDIRRTLNDKSGAIAAYESAVAIVSQDDPDWLNTSHKLIVMLIESGRHARAIERAQELAARHPKDSMAYTLLGFAYLQTRDFKSAKQAFTSALAVNPQDKNAAQGLREAEANLQG